MNKTILFRSIPRIIMGAGTITQLPFEIKALKGKKALFVTDRGIISSGIFDSVAGTLRAAEIPFEVFDGVEPDPRYEIVEECTSFLKKAGADIIVGLGGGSPIDIAKTTSVMATNQAPVSLYFGVDLVPNRGLPAIIIPTTAGTGSEVTPIAILSDEGEKLKKGIVSPYLFPASAILDPVLTLGLPPGITAATGMDALIHAIEAYTSVNASGITDMFACRAMKLLYGNLRTAFANGKDLQAREAMMEGSLLAGIAFANAGVTAVHAFAYPIGAEFHIPHGVANTLMLPHVMRFNVIGNVKKFGELADAFGIQASGRDDIGRAELAVAAIERLTQDLKVPTHLAQFGVKEEDLDALAQGVMKVTRLLANNPRMMTREDAVDIYRAAL
jgi:alcohol dehydrogenase class IV